MPRLNLTLDADTAAVLGRYAQRRHVRRAAVARDMIRESLARYDAREKKKRLAVDYAAGRADARRLLEAMETGQIELLGDEED